MFDCKATMLAHWIFCSLLNDLIGLTFFFYNSRLQCSKVKNQIDTGFFGGWYCYQYMGDNTQDISIDWYILFFIYTEYIQRYIFLQRSFKCGWNTFGGRILYSSTINFTGNIIIINYPKHLYLHYWITSDYTCADTDTSVELCYNVRIHKPVSKNPAQVSF